MLNNRANKTRERQATEDKVLDTIERRGNVRTANRSGNTPTPNGTSGAYDSTGAYTPYHRAGSAIDSVDEIFAP